VPSFDKERQQGGGKAHVGAPHACLAMVKEELTKGLKECTVHVLGRRQGQLFLLTSAQ